MEQFAHLLRSKDTCIYVQTYEENEVVEDICGLIQEYSPYDAKLKAENTEVYTYSRFDGLHKIDPRDPLNKDRAEEITDVNNITKLFRFIKKKQNNIETQDDFNGFQEAIRQSSSQNREQSKPSNKQKHCLFILKDMHLFLNDKEILRAIRDLKENMDELCYSPIIVTSPTIDLPCELEKIFTYFEYEVMSENDIWDAIYEEVSELKLPDEAIRRICKACVGLTYREILRALYHSVAKYSTINIDIINEEKIQIVKKSGALDYLEPKLTIEDVGGYENLKTWIRENKAALDPEAIKFGVPQPKGAMLVGLPGNGKTMAAEVMANYLNVPLLNLDLARIMGSFVGQSERQIANALRIAKACAPCVMLIDEAEKLFGGYKSSSSSDAGTLSRVLAQLLQFLQEDNTGVITIMTSNNVFELPPELTRSGRLDAQWYFGFPTADERRNIFDIYIKKNNLEIPDKVVDLMIRETKNYSGAEIKEVVKNVVVKSYYRQKSEGKEKIDRTVTVNDVKSAIASVIPIFVSSEEKIKEFMVIAKGKYRAASAEAI